MIRFKVPASVQPTFICSLPPFESSFPTLRKGFDHKVGPNNQGLGANCVLIIVRNDFRAALM